MNRRSKWVIFSLAGLGLAVVLALGFLVYFRATGRIQFYTVPTAGSEPAIPSGGYILATKVGTPERFDLICYQQTNALYERATYVQRVCGLPGDTVMIQQGVLHINGVAMDAGLRLKHLYRIPRELHHMLLLKKLIREDDHYPPASPDSVDVLLEDAMAETHSAARKVMLTVPNPAIVEHFAEQWSQDMFGPLVIPAKHYFFLGDNRDASLDSRYLGPISEADLTGVVFHVF